MPDFKVPPDQHLQGADKPMQTRKIADILKNAEQRESSMAFSRDPGNLRWRRDAGGALDRVSDEATPRAVGAAQSRDGLDRPQTSFERVAARDGSHRSGAESGPARGAPKAGSNVPNVPKDSQVRLLLEELTVLESRCATWRNGSPNLFGNCNQDVFPRNLRGRRSQPFGGTLRRFRRRRWSWPDCSQCRRKPPPDPR